MFVKIQAHQKFRFGDGVGGLLQFEKCTEIILKTKLAADKLRTRKVTVFTVYSRDAYKAILKLYRRVYVNKCKKHRD